MQIIINSAEELINLRKSLCVYRKRRQLSINSIQRLREDIQKGAKVPRLKQGQTLEGLDAIHQEMIDKRQESIDWATSFIEQLNLQTEEATSINADCHV